MLKILRVPNRLARLNQEAKLAPSPVHSDPVFYFPRDAEEEAGVCKISKWLKLADAALAETERRRKRA